MFGLALVQKHFIADPHERVAFPSVLYDFAPTSNLAVPQPAVTFWPYVARPIGCVVTLVDFAGHVTRAAPLVIVALAHEASVHHFAITFHVLGIFGVGHVIDAKDE